MSNRVGIAENSLRAHSRLRSLRTPGPPDYPDEKDVVRSGWAPAFEFDVAVVKASIASLACEGSRKCAYQQRWQQGSEYCDAARAYSTQNVHS